jgi:hypothetical protein
MIDSDTNAIWPNVSRDLPAGGASSTLYIDRFSHQR